ncbi:reverse transcriptase domain-containing protein [Tanacetum coccineum]
MDQIIRHDSVQETNNHKRKLEDKGNIINNNNYQDNYNNNNRNNDYHPQQNRRQETFRTNAATNGIGHLTRNCRNKRSTTGKNLKPISITYNACGEKGHYANRCSKANNRATGGRI